MTSKLLSTYRDIGHEPPSWAYQLPPSIPFVGNEYGKWNGILVYASAENLSHYERTPSTIPEYIHDDRVLNRHRAAFECNTNGGFFDEVHMEPFQNGSLLVACSYFIWKQFGETIEHPTELLESIAAANFCKFSISGKVNKDYAGDFKKQMESLPYVLADLESLKPGHVLIPKKFLTNATVKTELQRIAPNTKFWGLPQFNATVINTHLKKHAERSKVIRDKMKGTSLATWIDHLEGYGEGFPYRFLVEIDDVLHDVK